MDKLLLVFLLGFERCNTTKDGLEYIPWISSILKLSWWIVVLIGISHNLSVLFLVPVIISLESLCIFMCWLSRLILYPSLHNCLRDIREELIRSGRTTAVCAFWNSLGASSKIPCSIDGIVFEFSRVILRDLLDLILERHLMSNIL